MKCGWCAGPEGARTVPPGGVTSRTSHRMSARVAAVKAAGEDAGLFGLLDGEAI